MCCGDRNVIITALGPAAEAVKNFASPTCDSGKNGPPLQFLELPSQTPPVVVPVSSENFEGLLKRARESTPAVLGFDIEWSSRPSGPRRQVALVQLSALDGYTALFDLKSDERRPGIKPTALKELLICESLQLVSFCFV